MGRTIKRRRAATTGVASGYTNENFKVFRSDVAVEAVRPDWEAAKRPTCVHLTGAIESVDPMTGNPLPEKTRLPFRSDRGLNGINNYLIKLPIVSVGNTDGMMIQFILCDLPEDGKWRNDSGNHTWYGQIVREAVRAYQKRSDPKNTGFRAKYGKKEFDPADWAQLIPGQQSHYKHRLFSGCGRTQLMGILPCATLVSNEYLLLGESGAPKGLGEGDVPQMLIASFSALTEIERKITAPAEGYSEQTGDPDSWLYGDPTNPDGTGKWMVLYQAAKESDYLNALGRESVDIGEDDDDDSSGKKDDGKGFRYAVEFIDSYIGPKKKKEGRRRYDVEKHLNERTAANHLENYDDIYNYVYLADQEEQALWMYEALSQSPHGLDILMWGARDIADFWTPEIKAKMKNRKNIVVTSSMQDEDVDDEVAELVGEFDVDDFDEDDTQESGISGAGLDLDDDEILDDIDVEDAIADLDELQQEISKSKVSKKKPVKKTTKKKPMKKASKTVVKKTVKKKVVAKKPTVKKKVVKKKKA